MSERRLFKYEDSWTVRGRQMNKQKRKEAAEQEREKKCGKKGKRGMKRNRTIKGKCGEYEWRKRGGRKKGKATHVIRLDKKETERGREKEKERESGKGRKRGKQKKENVER